MIRPRPSRRTGAAAAIIGLAVCAVYLTLVVYLRIDGYLLPGNEARIPVLPAYVPGTSLGLDITLPGVSTEADAPWTPASRINVLVMGLDKRPEDPPDEPTRSDTMFVMSIDRQTGRVQMLAIPRDLWAEVPYGGTVGDWAEAKVNAAYSYGMYFHYPGGGPASAIAAVQQNYNIKIDHYVAIDWVGFVRLIDAIGGIDITVPEDISDFATDVLDVFPDHTVKAGEQHMDGKQVLGYSRVRVDGDIKRIERQQLVIRAVASRSVSLGYIAKLPELWNAYHDAIKTDIDTGLVPGFALLARQLDYNNLETFSLAPATYGGIASDGELILLPKKDEMYAIIDQFLADPKTRDESPVVGVAYADGQDKEASDAKAHMVSYGIPPEDIKLLRADAGSAPGIFDVTGKTYTAAKLTELFNLRLLNPVDPTPEGIDVLVRLGDGLELKSP